MIVKLKKFQLYIINIEEAYKYLINQKRSKNV
nr:MAG TPA: hypothetical protein [Caudoviricetes sp.]